MIGKLLFVLFAVSLAPLHAAVVIADDFDGVELGSHWSAVSGPEGVTVSTEVSASSYSVTSLEGPTGEWATHTLLHTFAPVSDFDLTIDLAWDSSINGGSDMLRLGVRLLDADGFVVASMSYNDAWVQFSGHRLASGGDEPAATYNPGVGTEALAGDAALRILRSGSAMTFSWNGEVLLSEVASSPAVTGLELFVGAFQYSGPLGDSTFSPVRFDSVSLAAGAVPEPASILMLGMALGGLLRRRRAAFG